MATRTTRLVGALSLVSSLALIAAGCGSGTSTAKNNTNQSKGTAAFSSKPTRGGTITVAWTNPTATLDPAFWDDGQSEISMQQIYNTLVQYDKNSAKLVGGLATHWTLSNGNKTYTFFLRKARFSNGDPVTAQDVAFSLDRVSQPGANSPYSGFALSDIVGFNQLQKASKTSAAYTQWSSNPMPLSGIKVINAHELSITVAHPEAFFLNDLALEVAGIQDPAVVKKYGPTDAKDAYESHAVGSGPFELVSWNQNSKMVLKRNPYYWGPKPYLDKVVQLFNVSDQTAYEMFQQGKVQILYDLGKSIYLEASQSPKTAPEFHKAPMNWVLYGYMNMTQKPFNNVYVRQALNYGFSKKQLIKVGLNGLASQPTDGVLPPQMPGYVNSQEAYPYNPTKAKQLLKKAGYGSGLSFKYYIPADTTDQAIGAYLQQAWAKIGVHIKVVPVSTSIYWSNAAPPATGGPQTNYDAGDAGWVQDYPDPSDFLTPMLTGAGIANPTKDTFGGNDSSNYDNPKVDKLIAEANQLPTSQDAKRYKLYDQAQSIIEKQAPWLFMAFMDQTALISSKVGPGDMNLYLHPITPMLFQYMWVNK